MRYWRKSPTLAAVIASIILLVQLAVPVSRLVDGDQASRFGWQMFSGSRAFPQLVVETPDDEIEVTLSDYLVRERVEIDVAATLPPFLCEAIPDAVTVRWEGGSYRC